MFDQNNGKPIWRKFVIYTLDSNSHQIYRLESTQNPAPPGSFPTETAGALSVAQLHALTLGAHPSQDVVSRYVASMSFSLGSGAVVPQSPSPLPSPQTVTAVLQLQSNEANQGPQRAQRQITVQLRNSRRRRGAALITAMYVAFFILLFGMTLATLSTFEYQFTNESLIRGRAFEAAQAGLAQAVYNLSDNSNWNASLLNQSVASDGSTYSLTFNNTLGIPWSVNNLNGTTSVVGWQGQTVPQYCALLVATGTVPSSMSGLTGSVETRVVEELVQYTSYPYALAASNQITAATLTVGGNNSLSDVLGGIGLIPVPGNGQAVGNVWAGNNGNGSIRTVDGVVTGKVRTPGTAALGLLQAAEVDNGVAPETLPDINISNYSTVNTPGVTVLPGGSTQSGTLSGPIYVNGDLTLDSVTLNNATIYLDGGGNLISNTALTGTGSIFVTGTTQIKGLSTQVINSGIAIFSQGDISITGLLGLGVSLNVIEGVLYSHGNINVGGLLTSTFHVVGAMMAQSTNTPTKGNITFSLLTLPTITYVPEFTQFGGYMNASGMQGGLLNGTTPLMHVLFWREVQ